MNLEDMIRHLTLKTASGGGFWLGSAFLIVLHGSDWWEWKCWGKYFYDLQDLVDEIHRRSGTVYRLVGYLNRSVRTSRVRLARTPFPSRNRGNGSGIE